MTIIQYGGNVKEMKMKQIKFFVILLLLLAMCGCTEDQDVDVVELEDKGDTDDSEEKDIDEGDNTNTSTDPGTASTKVTAPEYIIGEYWVVNTTEEAWTPDFSSDPVSFLEVDEIIGEETVEGIPSYVKRKTIKAAEEGEYQLDYLAKDDVSRVKVEIYKQDKLASSESYEPPLPFYPYPFDVNETFSYRGFGSYKGIFYVEGEIQSYEKKQTPAGEFDTYKVKANTTYKSALFGDITIETVTYYSPEMKREVYGKITSYMGEITGVTTKELIEHGVPPSEAPDIQN